MAQDSCLVKSFLQKHQSCKSVILEIFRRTVVAACGILAEASVVVAECGNTCPGKCICYDSKRLMLEELLITVLLAAACHHYKSRCRARISVRKCQGAVQHDVPIAECHFFCRIWEGTCGSLRAFWLVFPWCKGQRQADVHLAEGSCYLSYEPCAFIAGTE